MEGYHHFRKEVANYFRARFPFLYISTWEEERVIDQLSHIVSDTELIKTPRTLFVWSLTKGFESNGMPPSAETKDPLKALAFIEKYDQPAVFILKDFYVYLGANNRPPEYRLIRKMKDLVSVLEKSLVSKNVVLVAPTLTLPPELEKDITIVEFQLPSFAEIKETLKKMIEMNQGQNRAIVSLTEDEEERLVKAALGLTLKEAENAFALALVSKRRLDSDSVDQILFEKQQIIKKTGVLEFIKSEPNIQDVGGLENIKRWLNKRNKSWMDSAQDYGLPSPKGLLLTGVPGCGKSLIAKAVSSMWKLPLLKLDMGKIFSGIVGSSEENMRNALSTAEAISPSILWVDEIEKGLGNSGTAGDGGTSKRVLGNFLTWMQEKSKPVFVIATANNIDALPPEFLRKGRFDEIFFVDLPTKKERKEIFRIHLEKRLTNPKAAGNFSIEPPVLDKLAELTESFIGAEIEQVVISALFEAFSENRSLTVEDLEKVIKQTVPLAVTQSEQILAIREWASLRAVSAARQEDLKEYQSIQLKKDDENPRDKDADLHTSRGGRAVEF
ncbi:AAA family ATPase [Bacillus licheniformis]|uniref:AAA family ATPase n=1 Tax=Bacillus licheniformis TaxID=1402 RepID=UPI0009518913|nr:AAA family ATPase [Bacillus licheniformis]OLQ48375.1 ATPase [Bacillus licheniformis]TWM84496.1 ATP-dependent zinc metalloprotease FtsH [Bacillus licheniformis]